MEDVYQPGESEFNIMEKVKPVQPMFRYLVPVICTISLLCYLIFSHGLRYFISGWRYRTELYKMVFPKGFWEALPQHLSVFPNIFSWHNGLLLPLCFLSACVASAWLAHSLIRGRRSELGPHLILFSMAAAIVPSLLLAIFFWPDGRGTLTIDAAFYASLIITIILGGFNLAILHRGTPSLIETESKDHGNIGWAWAFILPLVVLYAFAYLIGAVSIIGYDALAYHLPLAASWFHAGSIIRGANIQFYYPGNPELMLRWVLADNSERFVFLVSFVSTLLCIYMIYKLGRTIGQGKQTAVISACCAATVPMLPFLATTAYTDTMGVLFLLLSIFFLIRWIQTDLLTNSHFLCSGLAAGLAAGSKINMLTSVFAIAVVAVVAAVRSRQIWRRTGPRVVNVGVNWPWLLTHAGGFFTAALIGGGYWYLRNFIEKGNPFYPVAIFGLPGLDLKTILPTQSVFVASPWKWFLYPWTELAYTAPYDDGIGAVATTVALPALLIWPFLSKWTKDVKRIGPGLIYSLAWISLLLFAWSDNMISRYGIFFILICFILLGEIWSAVPSLWFKTVTYVSFLIMTAIITQSLAGGYLYMYLRKNDTRAEKLSVPEVVDSLAPRRIFNAAGAAHTYGLMGRDYRHEVITLYGEAKPEDVLSSKATYVLLTKTQEETFRAKLQLEHVGSETKDAYHVSLWKIIGIEQHAP
jgi:hypothetical protein